MDMCTDTNCSLRLPSFRALPQACHSPAPALGLLTFGLCQNCAWPCLEAQHVQCSDAWLCAVGCPAPSWRSRLRRCCAPAPSLW